MAKLDKRNLKVKGAKERKLEDHITGKATVVENNYTEDGKAVELDVTRAEVHSDTTLEMDTGHGQAVVMRFFDFLASPEAFKKHQPSKQELFNSHKLQIEGVLYSDGLKIFEEFAPKIMISKNKRNYRIVVAGLPSGMQHADIPTLSQIANGNAK